MGGTCGNIPPKCLLHGEEGVDQFLPFLGAQRLGGRERIDLRVVASARRELGHLHIHRVGDAAVAPHERLDLHHELLPPERHERFRVIFRDVQDGLLRRGGLVQFGADSDFHLQFSIV